MSRLSNNKFMRPLFLLISFFFKDLLSLPTLNHYDPYIYHSIACTDKFYTATDGKKIESALKLSPFYQHASGARGKCGAKVAEGDIFGRWNMFGLFFGIDQCHDGKFLDNASPNCKKFIITKVNRGDNPWVPDRCSSCGSCSYINLKEAWRVLDNQDEGATEIEDGPNYEDYNNKLLNLTSDPIYYTDPCDYQEDEWEKYFPYIFTEYEKYGVRGQFDLNFKFGLGLNIKGGVVEYKQCPRFEKDSEFLTTVDPGKSIDNYLMNSKDFERICNEVGLDIGKYQVTTLEDIHVQLFCNVPYNLMDRNDQVVVTFSPYIAVGAWLPTGKEKNQDIAFSVPTGNDGFWGLTADGALNFDFPGMAQLSFGLGGSWFFSRNLHNYRVPSHQFQQGIFPWKAAIKKRPGPSWYFNASLKAENFILDSFTAFFDYIYVQHNQDDIKMREPSECRNSLFKPEILEELSKWHTTLIHAGLSYRISPGLELGLSAQVHYSGVRVYKNTTILGTIAMYF